MITSLEGLLEQHAAAALRISGADQTSWNGEIVEAGEGILGLAHWDGTLHLDRECILDPLRDLYRRGGEPRTDAELIRYREALVTLLHEQSHFLGPAGATQEAARTAFKLPGGRALEEGVAEAWAHDHLNDYVRDLEIDKVAPGILDVRCEPSYAAFVPAVRLFTADLDRQAGSPPGEALHLLNRQTAEGQWHQAVTRIYHSSRLPHLVPPDQAPTVRLHLEQALRTSFKGLELYEPFPRGFAASRSHSATTRLLTFLHQELVAAERHYTPATRPTRIHLSPPTLTPPPAPLTTSPTALTTPTPTHPYPQPQPTAPAPAQTAPQSNSPARSRTAPHDPAPAAPHAPAPAHAAPQALVPVHTQAPAHVPLPGEPQAASIDSASADPDAVPHVFSQTRPTDPALVPASAPIPAATPDRHAIDSPHLAIHHAFAGLTPPTTHPAAPPNAPPGTTPGTNSQARELAP